MIIFGLCALSVWQAGSWSIGFLFIGAISLSITVLFICAQAFVRGLAWVPMPRALSLRYALGNVVRPGSQATGIMVAIGIGVMVIVTVSLVEQALLHQIQDNRPTDAPTFFFIDIQPDQAQEFVSLIEPADGACASRAHAAGAFASPCDRWKVITVDEGGEKDEKRTEGNEGRGKQWYFTREYVLTFLDRLPKDNTVIKGEWWKPGQIFSTPQVSVEEDAAMHLGLTIGSIVEFDIQGATVSAEVSSIRKVEWGNFSTNFYMILSPGSHCRSAVHLCGDGAGLGRARGPVAAGGRRLISEHQRHPYRRCARWVSRGCSIVSRWRSGRSRYFVLWPADWSWRRHSQRHATGVSMNRSFSKRSAQPAA